METIDISHQLDKESSTSKFRGKILSGIEFLEFMNKSVGEKFRVIRTTLNKIYKNQYKKNVTDKAGVVTYLGLKKIEEGNNPRRDTVELLAQFYDIPLYVFYPDEYPSAKGLFIAQKADKEAYFNAYFHEHLDYHPLDPRYLEEENNKDINECLAQDYDVDELGFPWVDDLESDAGQCGRHIDTLSVHMTLSLISNSDTILRKEVTFVEEAKLSFKDIEHLQEVIRKEMNYLSIRNEILIQTLTESKTYLTI